MRTAIGIALVAAVATTACGGGTPACLVEIGPWGDEMPDIDMLVGDTVETSLADYFAPADCLEGSGADIWEFRSSDPAAVAVSIAAEHVLTTVALEAADSVRVTVGPTYEGPQFFHDFYVSVNGASAASPR